MKYPSEKVLKNGLDKKQSGKTWLHLKLSNGLNGLLRSLSVQCFLMTL